MILACMAFIVGTIWGIIQIKIPHEPMGEQKQQKKGLKEKLKGEIKKKKKGLKNMIKKGLKVEDDYVSLEKSE